MVEATQTYKDMLDETRRNIHRSVVQMGPYRLAPSHQYLATSVTEWQELTLAQKLNKLRKIDSKAKDVDVKGSTVTHTQTSTSTATCSESPDTFDAKVDCQHLQGLDGPCKDKSGQDTGENILCDFDLTDLPEMVKGSWMNAEKILKKQGIGAAPGNANARVVISNSGSGYHHVIIDKTGYPRKCDCDRYQELKICAHVIATAYVEKSLDKIINRYAVHIPSLLKPSSTVGRKPSQALRKRKKPSEEPIYTASRYRRSPRRASLGLVLLLQGHRRKVSY